MEKFRSTRGMTLIEIILVLVLLGSVMAIIGRRVFRTFTRGQAGAAQLQIKQIEGWLDLYRLDCNQYPKSLEALLPGGASECANADPAGYAEGVSKIPLDPWNNAYDYKCDDGVNYEIVSFGEDRKPGGEGYAKDISSKDE